MRSQPMAYHIRYNSGKGYQQEGEHATLDALSLPLLNGIILTFS